jgi:hypothetical protein
VKPSVAIARVTLLDWPHVGCRMGTPRMSDAHAHSLSLPIEAIDAAAAAADDDDDDGRE